MINVKQIVLFVSCIVGSELYTTPYSRIFFGTASRRFAVAVALSSGVMAHQASQFLASCYAKTPPTIAAFQPEPVQPALRSEVGLSATCFAPVRILSTKQRLALYKLIVKVNQGKEEAGWSSEDRKLLVLLCVAEYFAYCLPSVDIKSTLELYTAEDRQRLATNLIHEAYKAYDALKASEALENSLIIAQSLRTS